MKFRVYQAAEEILYDGSCRRTTRRLTAEESVETKVAQRKI